MFLIRKANIDDLNDALKDAQFGNDSYQFVVTPAPQYREYYDKLVIEKNFKNGVPENVKVFNFPGKMIIDELSFVHRTAIKSLKKIMASKENPSEMEKLLIELCDADGDFTNQGEIDELVAYVKGEN